MESILKLLKGNFMLRIKSIDDTLCRGIGNQNKPAQTPVNTKSSPRYIYDEDEIVSDKPPRPSYLALRYGERFLSD